MFSFFYPELPLDSDNDPYLPEEGFQGKESDDDDATVESGLNFSYPHPDDPEPDHYSGDEEWPVDDAEREEDTFDLGGSE